MRSALTQPHRESKPRGLLYRQGTKGTAGKLCALLLPRQLGKQSRAKLCTLLLASHITKAAAHQQSQTEWCSGPRRLAGEPPADRPALLTHTAQTLRGCAEPAPSNQRSWKLRLHFAALPSPHLCRRGSWWGPAQVKHAQAQHLPREHAGRGQLASKTHQNDAEESGNRQA